MLRPRSGRPKRTGAKKVGGGPHQTNFGGFPTLANSAQKEGSGWPRRSFRRAGTIGRRGRSWKTCLKLGRYRTVRICYAIHVETSKVLTPPLRPLPRGLFFCAALDSGIPRIRIGQDRRQKRRRVHEGSQPTATTNGR